MSKKSSFKTASSLDHPVSNNNQSHTKQHHNFKKTIKQYQISFCPKEMIGKNLYGELRLGYDKTKQKAVVFRISPQPISLYINSNLKLQQQMSKINDAACQIYDSIDTKTNRYTAMEYFPKTFKSQLQNFQKSTKELNFYLFKFLQAYAKLYYLRITHGNISLENIGITFDEKVKLMNFRHLQTSFQEGAEQDYRDFKSMMCNIMLRSRIFPQKLCCLDEKNGNWQRLFSLWHIVHPYQYIYIEKRSFDQNIVVLLCKIQESICQCTFQCNNHLRIAIKLLMYQNLAKMYSKDKKRTKKQIEKLRSMLSAIFEAEQRERQYLIQFYNSIIWGFLIDPQYYGLTATHRLALICCFFQNLNHQYIYTQILKQLDQKLMYYDKKIEKNIKLTMFQTENIKNNETTQILADNLFKQNIMHIKNNLIDYITITKIEQSVSVTNNCQRSTYISHDASISQSFLEMSTSHKFVRKQKNTSKFLKQQIIKNKVNCSLPVYKNSLDSTNQNHYIKNLNASLKKNY